jgi:hypothetical protein
MTLVEPVLRRAPRGYPVDRPRVERLRLKNLTLYARHPLEPWLHEPRCREQVRIAGRARSSPGWAATSSRRRAVEVRAAVRPRPVP